MPDGDDLLRAQRLARELAGGSYVFGACSRTAADCSGFMSILINSVEGRANLFVRLFGTGQLPQRAQSLGLGSGLGDANDFNFGFRYPSESSHGIGHVAGTLGGLKVESRGHDGMLVGPPARGATEAMFTHHFHLPIVGVKAGAKLAVPAPLLLRPYPGHLHRNGGVTDAHVGVIQKRLNDLAGPRGHGVLGGRPLRITGSFGPNTERVVKVFQQHRGLEDDGVVGPKTWVRLFRK